MEHILSKNEFMKSSKKQENLDKAIKKVVKEFDPENRMLFKTFTREQQEDFIMELAFEDNVIEFTEEKKENKIKRAQ